MSFPATADSTDDLPLLRTERLVIAHVQPMHADALLDYVRRNDAHFAPWDPPRPKDLLTVQYHLDRSTQAVANFRARTAVNLVMTMPGAPMRIIGTINFNQIFRGPFLSCMLGYRIDAAVQGKGLMFEALTAAIQYVFTEQGLHRIQANYMAENTRSGKLLVRLGFAQEGFAKRYLYINGAWRDHVLTALYNPAPIVPSM